VQFEPTFVPLNAEGLPVSLDAVSLCDTNSESYGSCKLNIAVYCFFIMISIGSGVHSVQTDLIEFESISFEKR